MEKNEIIFFIILIIAYIISAVTLKIDINIQIMFGIIILIALLIAVILKYHQQLENEKISKASRTVSILLAIFYVITIIYRIFIEKPLLIDSTIVLILVFVALFFEWFFKKNEK